MRLLLSELHPQSNELLIEDIVKKIIELAGKGKYIKEKLPEEIKAIDIGNSRFDDSKLRNILGNYSFIKLDKALKNTIEYFKEGIK